MPTDSREWLARAQRLRAIAQIGQMYTRDRYDRERFDELATIANHMIADLTGAPLDRIVGIYLPETGYPTPKVDVRAGVFNDRGDVLLVQEAADGRWALPGGWADEHDTPKRNCEREVLEESGYCATAIKLVAVKDRSIHPYTPPRLERIYKLLFLCSLEGGAAATSVETTAATFFPVDALPELSVGRTLPEDIALLSAHRDEPGLPCYFD